MSTPPGRNPKGWRGKVAAAEHALWWSDSYNRADAIVDLFLADHPERIQLLGENWLMCDAYPPIMRTLLLNLPRPALNAMTSDERDFLEALPDTLDVWRGCYAHNRNGHSWTLNRDVALKFTTLNRYWLPGHAPLLLQGRVKRKDVLFVKLGRHESEVVPLPGAVTIVAEMPGSIREAAHRSAA